MKVVHLLSVLATVALTLSGAPVNAQDQAAATEKAKPRMSLSAVQYQDSIQLIASVRVRLEGGLQAVDFETVSFAVNQGDSTVTLGSSMSNDKGNAVFAVARKQFAPAEDGSYTFTASFDGNDAVKAGAAEVTIKPAFMKMSGEKTDSSFVITVKLMAGPDSVALPETELGLYVKRSFSNLKIGEGTTDENGEATIEYAGSLPGDENGNLVIIVRADDLEEYGTVSASVQQAWGVPYHEIGKKVTRALWTHAPPLWMVITFAILMTVVWGHYLYIIYKLIKLHKS